MTSPQDHYEDDARDERKREQEQREELTDLGLDPNDPDVTELAPEGMHPDEEDE